jgi:hypothetical protein
LIIRGTKSEGAWTAAIPRLGIGAIAGLAEDPTDSLKSDLPLSTNFEVDDWFLSSRRFNIDRLGSGFLPLPMTVATGAGDDRSRVVDTFLLRPTALVLSLSLILQVAEVGGGGMVGWRRLDRRGIDGLRDTV